MVDDASPTALQSDMLNCASYVELLTLSNSEPYNKQSLPSCQFLELPPILNLSRLSVTDLHTGGLPVPLLLNIG